MRVLMVSKACVVGAYQRKLEEIGRYDDVELAVVVPPAWREAGRTVKLERQHTNNYRLLVEPMVLNGRFHLHFYPGLPKQVHQIQPGIVHIDEEPYNLATFQAMWLARRVGARTVFFTWQNIQRRYPPPFSWMEQYVLQRADAAIAGNQEAADVVRAKGYAGPIEVIPQFGVDPELYKPNQHPTDSSRHALAPAYKRTHEGRITIGYIGRLVPEKGVNTLLKALVDLPGEWELRILGSGPLQSSLQQQARDLNLSDRVTFESRRPSSEIPAYLNELDVLVLPSTTRPNWKEQFGRVLIEAMACQVPVVGSTCGEIPSVIGDAGVVFPEGDADALHKYLSQLMSDPALRRRLGEAGRRRVQEQFTQAEIARRTVTLYRTLIEDGGG